MLIFMLSYVCFVFYSRALTHSSVVLRGTTLTQLWCVGSNCTIMQLRACSTRPLSFQQRSWSVFMLVYLLASSCLSSAVVGHVVQYCRERERERPPSPKKLVKHPIKVHTLLYADNSSKCGYLCRVAFKVVTYLKNSDVCMFSSSTLKFCIVRMSTHCGINSCGDIGLMLLVNYSLVNVQISSMMYSHSGVNQNSWWADCYWDKLALWLYEGWAIYWYDVTVVIWHYIWYLIVDVVLSWSGISVVLVSNKEPEKEGKVITSPEVIRCRYIGFYSVSLCFSHWLQ